MLAHPDMNLSDAVDKIEQEHPSWSPPPATGERRGEAEEGPEGAPRPRRGGPELVALQQEFATFRHLLRPLEAKEVDEAFKALAAHADPDDLAALRRRVRTLAIQAAFWRELAAPSKDANALGLVLLRPDGGAIGHSGATEYLEEGKVALAMRTELSRPGTGVYVMHLPVGRLVIAKGRTAAIASLFRHAPGKEVVSVLQKTLDSIDENPQAAQRTFGSPALAGRYAEALLKLVQRVSA